MAVPRVLVVTIILTLLLVPVAADLGPKPKMEFNIVYEMGENITLIGGQQLQCETSNCQNASPLQDYGPQQFRCEQEKCRSLAYSYAPYQKLSLNFSDRVRESNVFSTEHFDAKFKVLVTDSALEVTEETPVTDTAKFRMFIKSLIITLILETMIAIVFLAFTSFHRRVLATVFVVNVVSLTILYLLYDVVTALFTGFLPIALLELLAVSIEFTAIYYFNKQYITRRNAVLLTLLMNTASFVIGGAIIWLSLAFMPV